jgi:glycosyltransferase involved in cell wall biosynthesis
MLRGRLASCLHNSRGPNSSKDYKLLRSPAVLYITYDGILEPLGQSQVLGYLEKLAEDWPIYLISYEKRQDRKDLARMEAMRHRLKKAGISWKPLTYHKWPTVPATAFDIMVGTLVALRLAVGQKVQIVHARSYVPALIALAVKRVTGAKFLFDMRGFWADERVDGRLWPRGGKLYSSAKSLERMFLLMSDHVVTLTRASKREIESFDYLKNRLPRITVIPTCADLEKFTPLEVGGQRPFTVGYVGSVGMSYLLDEIFAFFRALIERIPDASLLFVSRSPHHIIYDAADKAGIEARSLKVVSAEHGDVPNWIAKMTVGIALYRPAYAEIARCPTKFAEYLGCGVPCIANIGVGDIQEYLETRRVGVALQGFTSHAYQVAVDQILELLQDRDIKARCVAAAHELFSLKIGVASYQAIYSDLSASKS